jgi:hypothetical protein
VCGRNAAVRVARSAVRGRGLHATSRSCRSAATQPECLRLAERELLPAVPAEFGKSDNAAMAVCPRGRSVVLVGALLVPVGVGGVGSGIEGVAAVAVELPGFLGVLIVFALDSVGMQAVGDVAGVCRMAHVRGYPLRGLSSRQAVCRSRLRCRTSEPRAQRTLRWPGLTVPGSNARRVDGWLL